MGRDPPLHNCFCLVQLQGEPCSPELNLELLAENFEITGANIRNIALTAAFLAADDGKVINMKHLIGALRREYQKMGHILREKDLGEYINWR